MPWTRNGQYFKPSFYRRAYGRRKPARKTYKRRAASTARIPRAIRSTASLPAERVHLFTRDCILRNGTALTYNTALGLNVVGAFDALSFNLVDLPNVSEFVNLFQFYKFGMVELSFYVTTPPIAGAITTGSSAGTANAVFGKAELWVDKDVYNPTAPTDINILQQRSTTQKVQFDERKGNKVVVRLKPEVLNPIYGGLVTTAYARGGRPWLTTNNVSVPHYGIEFAIRIPFNGVTAAMDIELQYRVEAKYFIACKGVH